MKSEKSGIWLLTQNKELFMSFQEFPWFKKASVEKILNIVEQSPGHFYWPDLDVDLVIESIENPSEYPLKSELSNKRCKNEYKRTN